MYFSYFSAILYFFKLANVPILCMYALTHKHMDCIHKTLGSTCIKIWYNILRWRPFLIKLYSYLLESSEMYYISQLMIPFYFFFSLRYLIYFWGDLFPFLPLLWEPKLFETELIFLDIPQLASDTNANTAEIRLYQNKSLFLTCVSTC